MKEELGIRIRALRLSENINLTTESTETNRKHRG